MIHLTIELVIPTWLERLFLPALLAYRRVRYGYAFRLIRLAQPQYAKVDPDDYDRLRRYEWHAHKGGKSFYARARAPGARTANRTCLSMHREVLDVPAGMVVDHINHDGLDNRKANLRPATRSQNAYHRKKRSHTAQSKYKGINWSEQTGKWQATITFEKKRISLGYFRSEIDAARAYDGAAIKYHGEFASLNFPQADGRPV